MIRIHSVLTSAEEDHADTDLYEPDCSSISDAHAADSFYLLFKELNSHLDLKENIPDNHAKQVRMFSLSSVSCK